MILSYRLIFHEYYSSIVVVLSVLSMTRWIKRKLDKKYLGQVFDEPDYLVVKMKNVSSSQMYLPFLLSISAKITWAVPQATGLEPQISPAPKIPT